MANLNIRTPRFYVDRINYILNRGRTISQSCEIQATSTGNNTVAR